MDKVAITGAKGTIGTAMSRGLTEFEIVPIDLPEADARDIQTLLKLFKGCRAVIHLAWDLKVDNWDTGKISPDNSLITYNVYQACLEAKVPRVMIASSVHADNFMVWDKPEMMKPYTLPTPTSPYGANKVLMEAMGRHYTTRGLEAVCIRFGAVNKDDRPTSAGWDWRKVWLSHRDGVALMRKCIQS